MTQEIQQNKINVIANKTPLVQATTITVTNTNDSGPGSLREAINAAVEGSTIVFSGTILPGSITLTSGPISNNKTLTITGPGANRLTINGSNNRIFIISGSNTVVKISDLTFQNGFNSGPGGAILNQGATLNILRCRLLTIDQILSVVQ